MRRVRRLRTAVDGFQTLLAQGLPKFGFRVISEKQQIVDRVIDTYLAAHPQNGFWDQLRKVRRVFTRYLCILLTPCFCKVASRISLQKLLYLTAIFGEISKSRWLILAEPVSAA